MQRAAERLQDQLNDHLTETKLQIASTKQLEVALSEKTVACDSLRNDLEEMLRKSLTANAHAQSAADEATREIDRLEHEVCAAKADATSAEQTALASHEERQILGEKLEQLTSENDRLRSICSDLESEAAWWRSESQYLSTEVSDWTLRLHTLESDLLLACDAGERQEALMEQMSDETMEMEAVLESRTWDANVLSHERDTARAMVESLEENLEEIRSQLDERQIEVKNLKAEVAEAKAARCAALEAVVNAESEAQDVAKARKLVHTLQNEHAKLATEKAELESELVRSKSAAVKVGMLEVQLQDMENDHAATVEAVKYRARNIVESLEIEHTADIQRYEEMLTALKFDRSAVRQQVEHLTKQLVAVYSDLEAMSAEKEHTQNSLECHHAQLSDLTAELAWSKDESSTSSRLLCETVEELRLSQAECDKLKVQVTQQESDISRMHLDMIDSEEEMRQGMDALQEVITTLLEAQQTLVQASPPPPPLPTSSMEQAAFSTPVSAAAVRSMEAVLASPGLRAAASKLREMSRLDPSGPPEAMLASPLPVRTPVPEQQQLMPAPVPVAVGIVTASTPQQQEQQKLASPTQDTNVATQTPRAAIASFISLHQAERGLASLEQPTLSGGQSLINSRTATEKKTTPRAAINAFLNALATDPVPEKDATIDGSNKDLDNVGQDTPLPLSPADAGSEDPGSTCEQIAVEQVKAVCTSAGVFDEETPPVSTLIRHFDGDAHMHNSDTHAETEGTAETDGQTTAGLARRSAAPAPAPAPSAAATSAATVGPSVANGSSGTRSRRSRWGPKPPAGPPPVSLVGQARTVTQAIELEQQSGTDEWSDWMDASTSVTEKSFVDTSEAWFSVPATEGFDATFSMASAEVPTANAMDTSGWIDEESTSASPNASGWMRQETSVAGGLYSHETDALAIAKQQLLKINMVIQEHEATEAALASTPDQQRISSSRSMLNEVTQSQNNSGAGRFHPGGTGSKKEVATNAAGRPATGGNSSIRRTSGEKKKGGLLRSKIPKKAPAKKVVVSRGSQGGVAKRSTGQFTVQ
jgi:predicted  nucleic acid-binding Zn-ribbon protein